MTRKKESDSLRLRKLEIENVLRVAAFSVDCDGNHVFISGPNGGGKTSVLDTLWMCLKGYSSKTTPEPIKRGKSTGKATADLGDFIITRTWTPKGSSLDVRARDGKRFAKPQAVLDGLLGKYALDPVAFLEQRPQDQVDDVLGLHAVVPPVDQVQELTGERHEPRAGESADAYLMRLSADETGLYYVRRRERHREVEEKEAALAEQQARLQQLGGPLGPLDKAATAGELVATIQKLQQQAEAKRQLDAEAQQRQAKVEQARSKFATLENTDAQLATEIGQIEERLARLREQRNAIAERLATGREVIAEFETEAKEAKAAAAEAPDVSAELAEGMARLQEIEQGQKALAKRRAVAEEVERLAAEAAKAKAAHQRQDICLAGLRSMRAHLLDGLDLGVPGLTVGDGTLMLDGIPFTQASLAQRIRVACAVAMHQNPRLKLLRVDNGEHLDSASRKLLLEMADQHDWQVIYTMVADQDDLRVEIVEGADWTEEAKDDDATGVEDTRSTVAQPEME